MNVWRRQVIWVNIHSHSRRGQTAKSNWTVDKLSVWHKFASRVSVYTNALDDQCHSSLLLQLARRAGSIS